MTVPPTLGRIVAVGPDSISYQSYPGSLGTDTFTYQVTDPYGLTGTRDRCGSPCCRPARRSRRSRSMT